MKPYGIPRSPDFYHPDVADSKLYGNKASDCNLQGKGGDIRSTFKNAQSKRNTRRMWKRIERNKAKDIIKHEIGLG